MPLAQKKRAQAAIKIIVFQVITRWIDWEQPTDCQSCNAAVLD